MKLAKVEQRNLEKERFTPFANVTYEGHTICHEPSAKFLGVFLDYKMTGVPHLNYVINKCEKGINVLRALSGVWWISHPYNQKLLYNALIRSCMDYGSFILEPCNKTALKNSTTYRLSACVLSLVQ
uniref:SFRICE_030446 n=1 Tax=Spodoptera frugiperda TaxID=7108 RepID=A0A2H1VRS1_SPOFR